MYNIDMKCTSRKFHENLISHLREIGYLEVTFL